MSEALIAARPRWPARALAWLIAAAVAFFAVRSVDFGALGAALRSAAWGWVALALVCNLVANTVARVRRWQALLQPIAHRQRASFFDLARLFYAATALSNLLPARAGEAVRVVELSRRRGYPAGALIAAQLAEKGIEAISLGLLCGACAILPGANPGPLALAGALAVAAVALLVALPGSAPGVAGRFVQALRAVHAERSWVTSLFWSILSDATDLVLVGLCLRALGIDVPLPVWALILLSINLAILLPSTPGQIGVLEAGAVVALAASGVAAEPALAFALVYHAVHLVPSTALGALAISLPAD
jgi:uncharacterized membrane protein YbhN (UPF0104 family)